MTPNAEKIKEFFKSEGSTIISVRFIKKDGTVRRISFNPFDRSEIKGFGPTNPNPNIIRVRDFDIARSQGSGAWRSFDVNRILSIKSRGCVYNFQSL